MKPSSFISVAVAGAILLSGLAGGPAAFAQASNGGAAADTGSGFQFTTGDLLAGLLATGLTLDLFHSGSSSSGGYSFSSPTSSATPFGASIPVSSVSVPFSAAPAGGSGFSGSGPTRPIGSSPSPVPEASTSVSLALMLLLGAGGVLSATRRRSGAHP